MHIIFYGPEGSGKGTQAKVLSETLKIPVLTSGDLVRQAAADDNGIIGDACRKALTEGRYVADSEMFVLWKRRLKQKDAQKDWIMDGFPRNVEQAKFLDDKLSKYGYKVEAVVYLMVSEEESLRRLQKRARPLHPGSKELHDSPERIKNRLKIYHESEKPLLEYYKKSGVLIQINGEQAPDAVQSDILANLPK
jgi:adenylate kinase